MSTLTKQSKRYLAYRVSEVQRKLEALQRSVQQSENILREVIDTIDPTYRHPIDYVFYYQEAMNSAKQRFPHY